MLIDLLESSKAIGLCPMGNITIYITWVKVFRTNPEFRIFRLTFNRKSASKC